MGLIYEMNVRQKIGCTVVAMLNLEFIKGAMCNVWQKNQVILHIPYQMGAVCLNKVNWSTLE